MSREESASRLATRLPLALVLFAFWIVLSGKLDFPHLAAGGIFSLALAFASRRLYALEPALFSGAGAPRALFRWKRGIVYGAWLGGEIFKSSLQVARVVLSPRLELRPRLVRFEARLPGAVARAILANSITLTPGTVTLDVRGDEFLVHSLTPAGGESLVSGDSGLRAWVASLYVEE